jgi:Flp pilus assembly protein TadG
MSRTRNERGQVIVLTVIALATLLGMGALVLDVGAWFHEKRQLQATADAAALAGAQALPDTPGTAQNMAVTYADKNGGHVLASDVTFSKTYYDNDTISVAAKTDRADYFSSIFKLPSGKIGATAKALVGVTNQAMYVAPMVVSCKHPDIDNCTNDPSKPPKFNVPTSLPYDPTLTPAPGAFGMLNLSGGQNPGTSTEADWILHGYNQYLNVNQNYRSDPGAKYSSGGQLQAALDAKMNSSDPVLLFPVYNPPLTGSGQNANYFVIGWIGFHITSYDIHGNSATLNGYFTTYIARGILASSGGSQPPNYGVKSIQLIG